MVARAVTRQSMGKDAARQLTDLIKAKAEELWYLLLKAYEGGAHEDLGYRSWGEYFEAEFHQTERRGYYLLGAARTVRNLIQRTAGSLDKVPNERQARELAALDDPEAQAAAWTLAQEQHPEGPTAAGVRDAVAVVAAEGQTGMPQELYTPAQWLALAEAERRHILEAAPRERRTTFNDQTGDGIEWAQWSWNPVTGCDHGCTYCYARVIAERFYRELPEGERFTPVFRPERLHAARHTRLPAAAAHNVGEKNVFVCSMADLFGKWVPQDWIDAVFREVVAAPQWNFLFLTKFPQRLAEQAWPDNAWCGTTVDTQARVATAERAFRGVQAGVKWLSCEPLLERLTFASLEMFDWVVIGGQSPQPSQGVAEFQPPWEWVVQLVHQAKAAGCKVYVKPNLRPLREYPGRRENA